MPKLIERAKGLGKLRQRAAEKLRVGSPSIGVPASQAEALAVLYQLASSPATAGDAMALLHELQVHQVEIDLQQEELRRSQSELEAELIRQAALVERAPVGYMTIDASTVLFEINLAGARLLDASREDLLGKPLKAFFTAASVAALQALIEEARDSKAPETRELQLMPIAGISRIVQAAADLDTTTGRFLLVLMTKAVTQPAQAGR